MKKVPSGSTCGRELTAYNDKDLEGFKEHFAEAQKTWEILMAHAKKKSPKGHGSITMGDGVAVWYLAPRKRKPESKIVVFPRGQGCGFYEPYKDFIVGFLKEQGIEAFYDYGRMD